MQVSSIKKQGNLPIENQGKTTAWVLFSIPKVFRLEIPMDGEIVLPELEPGDAFLFVDRERGVATGVRRLYLKRHEPGKTILYFDRFVDFEKPVPFSQLDYKIPEGTGLFLKIDSAKLEQALRIAGLPEFKALPMPNERDKGVQTYVRDLLQHAVVDDLLGPAQGDEEEIVGMSVRDRYLVGKLAPKIPYFDGSPDPSPFTESEENEDDSDLVPLENADHIDKTKSTSEINDEDNDDAIDSDNNRSLAPSSFGLTFCIDASLPDLEITATWGHYERTDSEFAVNPQTGKPARCWKRIPSGGTKVLQLTEGQIPRFNIDPHWSEVFIQGSVTKELPNHTRLVTLFLVNDQIRPQINPDAAWLFQPEIRVKSPTGAAIFARKPFSDSEQKEDELKALNMIYRRKVEFAVGHGISVHATPSEDDYERATEIKTVVLPQYEIPVTETPGTNPEDRPALQKFYKEGWLNMRRLAELPVEELVRGISQLTDDYEAWIQEQRTKSETPEFSHYKDSAEHALEHCEEILSRLRDGINVLSKDNNALEAFRFVNRVMAEQRVHSIWALSNRRQEKKSYEDCNQESNYTWRPFQLAFILLSIPSLSDPTHAERTSKMEAIADLLWFPTGGGKTEAYLGVAAFAMAIRRLQGDIGEYDGSRGLAVIMRYTLRLLTIQQFQRASTLICAMECERQKDPKKWGETRFSIGLWVGQKTTPNTTQESHNAIEKERDHKFGFSSTPAQLTTCPWCGSEIQPGREIVVNLDEGKTRIFCGDPHSHCAFSRKRNSEGLPVVVVDEEIYHRPPSMLIATVDKFAMMAWKGAVRSLFGKASKECPRHGLVLPDENCNSHKAKAGLSATVAKEINEIRPPDLIIQDEFHLISGPLGTMVGLYETAIDELCSWKYEGKIIRPKIVASTATVRKADEQVNNVFFRQVSIFPAYGVDVEDNFFSVQRPIEMCPGRRYLGICAPGASRPAVLIRVYVSLLTGAQALFNSFGLAADPYMTLVGYFNSLRELGGMRRLAEDDVQTRSFRVALATEVKRPGLAMRRILNVDELTSRVSNKEIPKKLDQLEIKFKKEFAKGEIQAMDVILATNMLSVGVDVNRLGIMAVNGQPKNTAEYIQATSRVGRSFPGLVCTVLTWSRPRDFSHYETFEHYHATFYKHVEAQSVTPFASRALDRGLTGTMVSMLRLGYERFSPNLGAMVLSDSANESAQETKNQITQRAWRIRQTAETKQNAENMISARIDHWVKEAKKPGRRLGYERVNRQGDIINLIKKPSLSAWDDMTVPMSMREVEPGVRLIMDRASDSGEDHPWVMQEKKDDESNAGGAE